MQNKTKKESKAMSNKPLDYLVPFSSCIHM